MDTLLVVVQVFALVCASVLCIYLIFVLAKVKKNMMELQKHVNEVSTRAIPVLENWEYISARVRDIADNIDDQVLMVNESIGSIKRVADDVVSLERKIQSRIEGPILDSVAYIAAIFKGVRTFAERLRS